MDAESLRIAIKTNKGLIKIIKEAIAQNKETHAFPSQYVLSRKIRRCWWHNSKSTKNDQDIIFNELFPLVSGAGTIKLSKEQFMKMIEASIDNAETYYMDPLQAVKLLCLNIEAQGGLKAIEKRLNQFVNKL